MNTKTGQIYRSKREIEEAKARGEPLVEVSPEVADLMAMGLTARNRKERRQQARDQKRRK